MSGPRSARLRKLALTNRGSNRLQALHSPRPHRHLPLHCLGDVEGMILNLQMPGTCPEVGCASDSLPCTPALWEVSRMCGWRAGAAWGDSRQSDARAADRG